MTNSKCEESDGVRKVRLKTTSGTLTLCYRSSQSSREADGSPDASSVEKVSQGGSQLSGVSKDSGFGSLPELFEFSDKFSIGDGSDECSNSMASMSTATPDFSTYNFWASEPRYNSPQAVCLSDTFSHCDLLAGIMDQASPSLEGIVDDVQCPEGLLSCATKRDPHFHNFYSTVMSSTLGEMNTNRNSYWDFPLELEDDIFECADYCSLLKEFIDERDVHGELVVDDFLVDRTPDSSESIANIENLDSDVLVYAPNRYLEDLCIFQSPPADVDSDVETVCSVGRQRLHDSQKRSRRAVLEDKLKDGQSMDIKCRNLDTTAVCPEVSAMQDVVAKHPLREIAGDKARVLRQLRTIRTYDFVNHRRRRFSALRAKRSKFPKRTTLTSLDLKRSPNQMSREIIPGRRVVRSPMRKSETERQLVTKSAEKKGRNRLPLPPSSVEILQGWLDENLSDPYPPRKVKEQLSFQTGLKMSQIENWLGNARQKLKLKSRAVKDSCNESSSSP